VLEANRLFYHPQPKRPGSGAKVAHEDGEAFLKITPRFYDLKDKRAVVYQQTAQVYVGAGDMGAALCCLEKGAAEASDNGDFPGAQSLWLATADLAEEANDVEKAIRAARAALALNPQNTLAQGKLQELDSKASEKASSARLD
jgi:tetratricopeptide (TPR) repeat protein